MPYTPEDLLFLDQQPQTAQQSGFDQFIGQVGPQNAWPTLFKMNELERDPAYTVSVRSWLDHLRRSNSMQHFPMVIDNLWSAKNGGPLGLHAMLQNMFNDAAALGVDPTWGDTMQYTGGRALER